MGSAVLRLGWVSDGAFWPYVGSLEFIVSDNTFAVLLVDYPQMLSSCRDITTISALLPDQPVSGHLMFSHFIIIPELRLPIAQHRAPSLPVPLSGCMQSRHGQHAAPG